MDHARMFYRRRGVEGFDTATIVVIQHTKVTNSICRRRLMPRGYGMLGYDMEMVFVLFGGQWTGCSGG